MGTFKVKDLYDSDGRCRVIPDAWFVYAIFCEIGDDQAMVKIGRAKNVYARIASLNAGICHPINVVLFVDAGVSAHASEIEALAHRSLKRFCTRGEWFKLNLADSEHKSAFHGGLKAAFKFVTGRDLIWRRIVPEQIRAYASLKARKPKSRKRAA